MRGHRHYQGMEPCLPACLGGVNNVDLAIGINHDRSMCDASEDAVFHDARDGLDLGCDRYQVE
jgi:hypothetical protein